MLDDFKVQYVHEVFLLVKETRKRKNFKESRKVLNLLLDALCTLYPESFNEEEPTRSSYKNTLTDLVMTDFEDEEEF